MDELFAQAVALPADQRLAWLVRAEPDPDIRDQVAALLQADESENVDLTKTVKEAISGVIAAPCVTDVAIGSYRLLREIGSGGMGVVFLAERVGPEFSQTVAIKVIRGIATGDASRRLRTERQILANLNHPHIARFLDGGTTESGQPFIAMEYVDGIPITEYCKSQLPHRARLLLLQKVARAIHHAHQHLVVHRDLKPANVLVRADGEPVLLDFGVAKLLSADSLLDPAHSGVPWFTPIYASPEQLRGEAVTTATDVYSLGILLFEIATGRPAKEWNAGTRYGKRAANAAFADRDLRAIVTRATATDPLARYASAEAFANDIERLLSGQAVEAAANNVAYQVRKFIQRHFVGVGLAALALTATALFTWELALERDRAVRAEARSESEASSSKEVVEYLMSLFDQAAPGKLGSQPIMAKDLIDHSFKRLQEQLGDQPARRARLLAAIGELYLRMGLADKAVSALSKAVATARSQADRASLSQYLTALAVALNASEKQDEAIGFASEAVQLTNDVSEGTAGTRVRALATLSLLNVATGHLDNGLRYSDEAVALAKSLLPGADDYLDVALNAQTTARLSRGDYAMAGRAAKAAVELAIARDGQHSDRTLLAQTRLAETLMARSEWRDAEVLLQVILSEQLKLYEGDSFQVVATRRLLAQALDFEGDTFRAIELIKMNVDVYARDPEASDAHLIELNALGTMQEDVGDIADAITNYRAALDIATRSPPTPLRQEREFIYRQNLGHALMLEGKIVEARTLLEDLAPDSATPDVGISRARRLLYLADLERRAKRFDASFDYLAQARQAIVPISTPDSAAMGAFRKIEGLLLMDMGALEGAEKDLRSALDIQLRSFGEDANRTRLVQVALADVLVRRGKLGEARRIAVRIAPSVEARFDPRASIHRDLEGILRQTSGSTPE